MKEGTFRSVLWLRFLIIVSQICEFEKHLLSLQCFIHNNMIVTFEYEYLKSLYENGKSSDKKHRFQPDIIRRYQKAIKFLKGASCIEALRLIRSLQYEVLSGDKSGRSSVRVNDQYRIEFIVTLNEKEPILTICNIVELSNHYK